ncbi:MAG: hypothetical protein AB3N14_00630 [Flavobacteriaceae bacterium]
MMRVFTLKNTIIYIFWSFLVALHWGCREAEEPAVAQIFEPENISTGLVEYATTFSTSGTELYFAKSEGQWAKGDLKSTIYFSVKEHNQWSKPKMASFSGKYDDSAPHLTDEGRSLYFISNRPFGDSLPVSQDIWKVERDEQGAWGDPIRLDYPINSAQNEYGLVTDKEGNFYIASDREGGLGQGDIYIVKRQNDGYDHPVNLGEPINSENGEWNMEVSQDGMAIIFEASQRKQNLSSFGDLYISYKLEDKWSLPQNIEEVNTTGSDLYPEFLEGEEVLFYSSSDSLKSTVTNIYSIGFSSLYQKYKKRAVFP